MQTDLTNQLPALYPGRLYLLRAARDVQGPLVTALLVRLTLRGSVRLLDGGNRFRALELARELRRRTPAVAAALERVHLARAFTCYQMAALLAAAPAPSDQSGLPAAGVPLVVLDLLASFSDENVALDERRRLLEACLADLARLSRAAPTLVTAAPSVLAARTRLNTPGNAPELTVFHTRLAAAADEVLHLEHPAPPAQLTLF